MVKLNALSDSDILILAIVAAIFGFVLGLLSDVVMRHKGFGPLRNTIIILIGGAAGIMLRSTYYPVPDAVLLLWTMISAIGAATVALALASVLKKLIVS